MVRVLVACAGHAVSTAEIVALTGESLRSRGLHVDVASVSDDLCVDSYAGGADRELSMVGGRGGFTYGAMRCVEPVGGFASLWTFPAS